MPSLEWLAFLKKVTDFFEKLGANKQKPSKETAGNKNQFINIGGKVVNNYFNFPPGAPLPNKKQRKGFKRLIGVEPYSLESLDLSQKKALIQAKICSGRSELIDFIEKSLPVKDQALWKAGLLLREYFSRREKEVVSQIKDDMMRTDIIRGKNIANLCTAGYLESEIISMHKALTDLERSEDFRKYYEALVTQTPTSVFVGVSHNEKTLKKELEDKVEYAKQYSAPHIKVHALGKHHVQLATTILKEIRGYDGVEDVVFTSLSESHLDATIVLK